jgi:hypothetical protein
MTKDDLEATRAKFKETMERQRAAAMAPNDVRPIAATSTKSASSALHTKGTKPKEEVKCERVARPSIRLIDEDLLRVREAMGFALTLNETLNTTEVLRLALHEWDFKKLTAKKIAEIRSQDGRRKTT